MVLGIGHKRKAEKVIRLWLAGNGIGALKLAEHQSSVRVRVLFASLSALKAFPNDKDYAREIATQTALNELHGMSRGMRGLDAVVQAAPMLGLLGTVVGMINAFAKLSATNGAAEPAVLAGGIWTALLTTAAGLAIALVFYLFSVWLDGRIARERHALEYLISSFLHGRVDAKAPGRKG
jgi:biopolymer transport protein ExbB